MPAAISLHIGVNRVNPDHYGTEARLYGCESDARAMQKIMSALGYKSDLLLNEQATAAAVLGYISAAASKIAPDGIFVITYAGHGSQLRDENGDEVDDRLDETWCLYDRMLVDDELKQSWSKFDQSSRVAVISDSCHSGTIARQMLITGLQDRVIAQLSSAHEDHKYFQPRVLPQESFEFVVKNKLEQYKNLAINLSRSRDQPGSVVPEIDGVSLISISGCQDNQTSSDGKENGVFTSALLGVWGEKGFSGSYTEFHRAILHKFEEDKVPAVQTPQIREYGSRKQSFKRQPPFATADLDWQPSSPKKGVVGMAEESLHPRVLELMQSGASGNTRSSSDRGFGGIGPGDRDLSGSCTVTFGRSLLDNQTDQQILSYFKDVVAPEICSNFFTARDAFSGKKPRGGEVSCKADTSGNVGCTGTWRF